MLAHPQVESTTGRPRSTNGTRRQKRDRAQVQQQSLSCVCLRVATWPLDRLSGVLWPVVGLQAEEAKKAQEKASTDAALVSR